MVAVPLTRGSTRFRGTAVRGGEPARTPAAGLVPPIHGRAQFETLSVLDNLRMGCLLAKQDERAVIEDILTDFPRLRGYLDRLGGALSGGEQQLLALARCLCAGPQILLLDEPTEGIQPSIIEEIAETLQAVGRRRALTILLVEQNLNFISTLSHRVLILQKGVITREVSPEVARDRTMIDEFVGMA